MSLTVDDILASRPEPLSKRAKAALEKRLAAKHEAEDEEVVDLLREVKRFLLDELECAHPEVEEIDFVSERHNDERMRVVFVLDGINFRAHYHVKKVWEGKSSQFEDAPVFDRDLLVEAKLPRHPSYKTVKNLGDLGALIA